MGWNWRSILAFLCAQKGVPAEAKERCDGQQLWCATSSYRKLMAHNGKEPSSTLHTVESSKHTDSIFQQHTRPTSSFFPAQFTRPRVQQLHAGASRVIYPYFEKLRAWRSPAATRGGRSTWPGPWGNTQQEVKPTAARHAPHLLPRSSSIHHSNTSAHVPDPLTLQHHHGPASRKGVVSRKKITPTVERCRKQSGPASKGQLPSSTAAHEEGFTNSFFGRQHSPAAW
ncbi:hypothetical protein VIGAN_02194600 [Vigna angularis var. angularis]|uniref:DUF4005 domain-containing protein n=1 Tax=Vigna angularis var. angularis TaxID=157739 RepID=A0A0S3REL2_PHAAN|nr:hypothetical protein VIGAN_02194600 [Vigna angularis var. angularis]